LLSSFFDSELAVIIVMPQEQLSNGKVNVCDLFTWNPASENKNEDEVGAGDAVNVVVDDDLCPPASLDLMMIVASTHKKEPGNDDHHHNSFANDQDTILATIDRIDELNHRHENNDDPKIHLYVLSYDGLLLILAVGLLSSLAPPITESLALSAAAAPNIALKEEQMMMVVANRTTSAISS